MWLGSAALVGRLIDLASLGVVLYFVSEGGLGEASVAWSISAVAEALTANGFGVANTILQERELRDEQAESGFWFALGVAAVFGVAIALAAPLLSLLYGTARLTPFLAVYALRHVMLGALCVPLQLLNRALRYRDVAAAQTVATLVAAIVRASVSITVDGGWAMVVAHCCQAAVLAACMFLLSRFRPRLAFSLRVLRPMLPMSIRIALADLSAQLFRNIDYVLVGYFLGMGPLGLYRIAFDVAMEVTVPLAELVNRSMVPVLARLQGTGAELRDAFFYSTRMLGLLLSPVLVALFAIVPDVLRLLGSGRFLEAASTARWLVIAAALRCTYQLFRPLLVATGRAAALLRMEVLGLVLLGTLLAASIVLLGDTLGISAAALAWVVVYPAMLAAALTAARKLEAIPPRAFILALLRGYAPAPLLAGAAALALLALTGVDSALLRIAAVIAAVVAAHFAFLRWVLHLRPGQLLRPG